MSIDKPNNRLEQDEAFIEQLYQAIEAENNANEENNDSYPNNTALDDKILAAAHRAVAAKPQTIKTKSKYTPWYTALATAASLVIVVSLVVEQRHLPLAPDRYSAELADDTVSINDQAKTRDIAGTSANTSVNRSKVQANKKQRVQEMVAESEFVAAPQFASVKQLSASSAKPSINSVKKSEHLDIRSRSYVAPDIQGSKVLADETVAYTAPQPLLEKNALAPAAQLKSKSQIKPIGLSRKSSHESVAEVEKIKIAAPLLAVGKSEVITDSPALTFEQYQVYQKQNLTWSLHSQTEKYYLIEVFNLTGDSSYFKLSKDQYALKAMFKTVDTIERFDFEHIELK